MAENTNVNGNDALDAFQRRKNKEEMKHQLISFALMIALTLVAFAVVGSGAGSPMFVIPFLAFLAVVQVGFQFYYFMHMKEKGHEMPTILIYGGVWAAALTIAGLVLISWW